MSRDALLGALRAGGLDPAVVEAVAAVDRARFVPPALRERAWEDVALPIGSGQTISQPSLVALMAGLLELRPGDRVLDVGTGSGYHAAVLSRLAAHVWSVERRPRLSRRAAVALAMAGVTNVTLLVGDGAKGAPEEGPFDAINVAATAEGDVPPALVDQLAAGGRLLAPVRDEAGERLVLLRREGGRLARRELAPVRFVPLVRD